MKNLRNFKEKSIYLNTVCTPAHSTGRSSGDKVEKFVLSTSRPRCMSGHHCVSGIAWDHKRALDLLKLEVTVVGSCQVGAASCASEQPALSTSEQSLQPGKWCLFCFGFLLHSFIPSFLVVFYNVALAGLELLCRILLQPLDAGISALIC